MFANTRRVVSSRNCRGKCFPPKLL